MKAKEITIRVTRTKHFKSKERPVEAQLEIGSSHAEYKVPLDAGKHASVPVCTACLDIF